jgi:uncharacterized protein YbjT (DUF2867 family)
MRVTIFAATGGIGRHLVQQALAAGHDVTAVARNPRNLPSKAHIVTADLGAPDPAVLAKAVDGADAVLSGLGPRNPRSEAGITSRGTRAIVAAMQATHVRRIVVVSAAPVGPVPSPGQTELPKHDAGDGFFMRHLGIRFAQAMFGDHYADLAVMEDILRDSNLDWTVSRPPKLTDKQLTGVYRIAYGQNIRGGFSVPRADVAHHMLRVLDQPETINKIIGIAT